eukprot:5568347-Pyramimonas_sp.AAC.1
MEAGARNKLVDYLGPDAAARFMKGTMNKPPGTTAKAGQRRTSIGGKDGNIPAAAAQAAAGMSPRAP